MHFASSSSSKNERVMLDSFCGSDVLSVEVTIEGVIMQCECTVCSGRVVPCCKSDKMSVGVVYCCCESGELSVGVVVSCCGTNGLSTRSIAGLSSSKNQRRGASSRCTRVVLSTSGIAGSSSE